MSFVKRCKGYLGRTKRKLTHTMTRADAAHEYGKLAKAMGLALGKTNMVDAYYNKKIRPKTILLVGLGASVRGNLQYILDELNYSDAFQGYQIYIRTKQESDETVNDYIRQKEWVRTKTVLNGEQYGVLMESCQFLLTEVYFPEKWVKKPGQTVINIWHGTPLKKLGLAKNFKSSQKNGNTQKNFINADYLLYPNEYTRDHMMASYKVASLLQGKVLLLGYPRTGGMLAASQSDLSELRRQLAPNGEKIYAYMPTFKDYLPDEIQIARSLELLTYLDEYLRENQLLYVNLHHRVSAAMDYTQFRHIRQFPPLVDSYTLLAATEALITDYSSVFFDYLALGRQIILHVEDYETYHRKRGTYINLMELPFDKAYSKEEVLEALNRGKTYDDTWARETFCGYDSPENAQKLCQLFLKKEDGLALLPAVSNTKCKTLIYSRSCQAGRETQLLHQYTRCFNNDSQEIYVGCDMVQVAQNTESAFPMLFETPVIGSNEEFSVSALSRAFRELYLEKKISLQKLMGIMKYDCEQEFRRMYGNAAFDRVILYDIDHSETLLALACANVPIRHLVLPVHVLNAAKTNQYLSDAIRYAAQECATVSVLDESAIAGAAALTGCKAGRIRVLRTAEDLDALH